MKKSTEIGWTAKPYQYNPGDKEKLDASIEKIEDITEFFIESPFGFNEGSTFFNDVVKEWNNINRLSPIGTEEWLTAWDLLAEYINKYPESAIYFVRAGVIPRSQLPEREMIQVEEQIDDFQNIVESIIDEYLGMKGNLRMNKVSELREELATQQVHLNNNRALFTDEEYKKTAERIQEVINSMDKAMKLFEDYSDYRGR